MTPNIAPPLQPYATPIDQLTPWPHNPNHGNIPAIRTSLETFGQWDPIGYTTADNGDKIVMAGNHRLAAALELGWTHIAAINWDTLTPDQQTALAVALNRTRDLATWDPQALTDLLDTIPAADGLLDATGYTPDDIGALLDSLPQPDFDSDPDHIPEPPPEPVTQPGDRWQLGPHTLICGDAYHPANMPDTCNAILTDPPYGMNLDTDYDRMGPAAKGATYRPVIGDDQPFDQLAVPTPPAPEQFWFGADWYRHTTPPGGTFLAWDKRVDPDHDTVIGSMFELIWSAKRHQRVLFRYPWTAYDQQRDDAVAVHPTQKPVALLVDILNRWTKPEATVLDPFAGSGSTLIAAEQTGRVCHAIELDPHYCDVIATRYQTLTGTKPERNSQPHDFL